MVTHGADVRTPFMTDQYGVRAIGAAVGALASIPYPLTVSMQASIAVCASVTTASFRSSRAT
jgi:hypothetical protein